MSMTSYGFGSSDPFGELLNRFFGMSPASSPPAVRRVPVGRLLTESAQELLNPAAQRAQQDGTPDLDTEHLLRAATQAEPARSLPARAEPDPDALAAQPAEVLPRESGEPSSEPGLTPAAERTLAAAYARTQAAGVSCVGPEHVLAALGEDDLAQIVEHLLGRSERRVRAQGMKPEVTEAAKKLLVAHGHQPESGVRPSRRTIRTELDNGIAELLLGGEAEPGDTVVADDRDGSVRCTVREGAGGNGAPDGGPSCDGAEAERGSAVPAGDTGGD